MTRVNSEGKKKPVPLGLEKCIAIKQNVVKVQNAMQNTETLTIVDKI